MNYLNESTVKKVVNIFHQVFDNVSIDGYSCLGGSFSQNEANDIDFAYFNGKSIFGSSIKLVFDKLILFAKLCLEEGFYVAPYSRMASQEDIIFIAEQEHINDQIIPLHLIIETSVNSSFKPIYDYFKTEGLTLFGSLDDIRYENISEPYSYMYRMLIEQPLPLMIFSLPESLLLQKMNHLSKYFSTHFDCKSKEANSKEDIYECYFYLVDQVAEKEKLSSQ